MFAEISREGTGCCLALIESMPMPMPEWKIQKCHCQALNDSLFKLFDGFVVVGFS